MPELGIVAFVVFLALIFDFTNGWNDAANAIATVISTRVLTPAAAVLLAGIFNIAGAFFSTAVAKTIAGDILNPSMVTQLMVAAGLLGGIIWNMVMTWLGLPISASHALIGGMIGAGLGSVGTQILILSGLKRIFTSLLVSPLIGLVAGFLLMILLYRVFFHASPHFVNKLFRKLQLVSMSFVAFSHGSGDGQKVMGIMTLALVAGGFQSTFEVPTWVIISAALAMGLGTAAGGRRVIRTLGMRMLKMEPVHGFAAESAAALIILSTARLGLPVSTTHVITSTILGVGASRRLSAVRWGIARKILWAWIFTLPGTAALSYVFATIFKMF
ncbi:MAG: inorganic phosphate transporter [Firmicutes bacterium]|nr:inorganic phosphate transporter [Bacillota bacterium]